MHNAKRREKAEDGRHPSGGNALSRRQFVRLAGAGLAGVGLLGASGCKEQGSSEAGGGKTTVRVIMEEVPDTDVVKKMLGAFNRRYPDITVNVEELVYDQMRDRIVSSFLAPEPTYDLIIVDNPWMYDFASSDYLEPLR